jgi:predicted nucleotidyltransferase
MMEKEFRGLKNVVAVYLFGSSATGKAGKLSDIDIGVLLKKQPKDSRKMKLLLIAKLVDAFRNSKIDLVILNECAPLLAFEVISKGKLIYGKRADVAEFEALTCIRYHDRKYYYDRYAEETINRIAEKGLK